MKPWNNTVVHYKGLLIQMWVWKTSVLSGMLNSTVADKFISVLKTHLTLKCLCVNTVQAAVSVEESQWFFPVLLLSRGKKAWAAQMNLNNPNNHLPLSDRTLTVCKWPCRLFPGVGVDTGVQVSASSNGPHTPLSCEGIGKKSLSW